MTDDNHDQKAEAVTLPILMLLEDDTALRSLLSVMFEQWGFKALAFPDGFRAAAFLDKVEAGEMTDPLPKLAVLDIRVPGPLGTEIAHRMRTLAATAHIPIVIMTAYRMDSLETDLLLKAIKPNAFLHKGEMDFGSLQKQLTSLLDSPSEPAIVSAANPQPTMGKDEVSSGAA